MPEDPVFNHEVDLYLASTMLSVLSVCEYPEEMWASIAERLGGEEAGFTAEEVQYVVPILQKVIQILTRSSQHFNRCLKNGELIEGEDGSKVFLSGEELIEHKYDMGEIDANQKDVLLSQIDENHAGCYIRKAIIVGDKILGGFSAFQDEAAEEAEDSDE
jgi:hypothetical protein